MNLQNVFGEDNGPDFLESRMSGLGDPLGNLNLNRSPSPAPAERERSDSLTRKRSRESGRLEIDNEV